MSSENGGDGVDELGLLEARSSGSRGSLRTGAAKAVEVKRGWRRNLKILFFLLVVLGGLGAGGTYTYFKMRNPMMYFVNGLDIPMTISGVGEANVVLGPRMYQGRVMEPGPYDISVSNGSGEEVAHEHVEVPPFTSVVVYNVGGIALLRDSTVTYRNENTGLEREDIEYTLFQTYTTRDDVDYVFETPPEEIRVRGEPPREVRRFFGLPAQMEFDIPWAWEGSVSYLANYRRQYDQAMRLLREVMVLDPANPAVRTVSRRMVRDCIDVQFLPYPLISFCDPEHLGEVIALGIALKSWLEGEIAAAQTRPPVLGAPPVPYLPSAFALVDWWPRIPPPQPGAPPNTALTPDGAAVEGSGSGTPQDPSL